MKSLTLFFVLLVASCSENTSNSSYDGEEIILEDAFFDLNNAQGITPTKQSAKINEPFTKKQVKTGNLTYQVDDVKVEYNSIVKILKAYDAYLTNESQNRGYDRINYNLTIKVLPQHFDTLIQVLSEDKSIENTWINNEDMTDRYYDLQARITNKEKLELRYQEILKEAKNVRDILEVERSLNNVRAEIESLQGQFKLLSHQVSFSTLNVSFYELLPYETENQYRQGFFTRILNALASGWHGFLSFIIGLIQFWPFLIIGFFAVLTIRKIRKRKRSQ